MKYAMTTSWDSLYLPYVDPDTVASTLRQALEQLGYTLYDPFGLMPARSYGRVVRLFVSPPVDGWLRVIGTPDPRLLMPLSGMTPCLYLGLQGDEAIIEVYARGGLRQADVELRKYLRPPHKLHDLKQALYAELSDDKNGNSGVFANLPDDIQALGDQVDSRQAQKMFDRLSRNLLKKAGSDDQTADAARELMNPPDWSSAGGQRIRAVVACLTLPDNWREPDFVTLRDAYQLHARRRRKPDARLYPGDDDVMARVPDALDYIPVYGGQDD